MLEIKSFQAKTNLINNNREINIQQIQISVRSDISQQQQLLSQQPRFQMQQQQLLQQQVEKMIPQQQIEKYVKIGIPFQEQFTNFLDPDLPICVIGCEGNVLTGQSTLMNLIVRHLDSRDPKNVRFRTDLTYFPSTLGCSMLNKKLVFKGVQIVLMEFESLGNIIDYSRNMEEPSYEQYLDKLIYLSFMIPSVLIIASNQESILSEANKLKQREIIHKRMATQKINLPDFVWFIREGQNQNPQQLDQAETSLKMNCPVSLQTKNFVSNSQIDQGTLDLAQRQNFQSIEDILLSATLNPQSLPKKLEFVRIFEDAFSFVNNINFDPAYCKKLGFFRVWEEWLKTELSKFKAAEKQLALDCEKYDDNGKLFEVQYKSMIQMSTNDIKKRLKNENIPLDTVAYLLDNRISIQFDLNNAKFQYLSEKTAKQAKEQERNETEKIIKKLKTEIQESDDNTKDMDRIIQEYKESIANQQQKIEEGNKKQTKEYITNLGSKLFTEKILPLLMNPLKLEIN